MTLRLVLLAGAAAWLAGRFVPGLAPLAVAGAWVGLGLAPGLALSRLLAPAASTPATVLRALFLGPVFTGGAGLGLLLAGVGVPAVSLGLLAVGFLLGAAALRGRPGATPGPGERGLVVLAIALALAVLVPHLAREWVRVRSDAVFHSAVALEILFHGAPPQDPYFAGLPLNYAWFYQALVALFAGAADAPPWHVTGILQGGWFASLAGAAFAVSRRLGRSPSEAWFAALFVPLGLGAFFYLWLPLKLARGLTGETAGWEHVSHLLSLSPFTWEQLHHVQSTWKSPPPVVNKYLVMTAWGGAFTALAWLVEAAAALLVPDRAPRMRAGVLAAFAAYGCWVLHPAMGLIAGAGGVLVLAQLLVAPGPVGRGAALRLGAAFVAGTLPASLLLAVSAARAEGGVPLGFDAEAVRGSLVGCTAAFLLGAPSLFRTGADAAGRATRALAAGLVLGSLCVVLPPPNTVDKIAFGAYLVPALAAGWTLGRWWTRGRGKAGRVLALALLLLPVNLPFVAVLLVEPAPAAPTRAERGLYDWLRTFTPVDSVVLDTAERDDVLWRVPRRQYWGREPYAEQWGYPAQEMDRRRAVRDALVNPGHRPDAAERAAAHRTLSAFATGAEVEVYVLLRHADFPRGAPELDPERYEIVREDDAARVARLRRLLER